MDVLLAAFPLLQLRQMGTPEIISSAGGHAQWLPDAACTLWSNYLSPVHEWVSNPH